MEAKKIGLSRDYIIHPGETLQEFLEERKMNQKELAIRTGVSEKHISTVLNGKKNISPDFSKKLEYALGIDSLFWMNLQSNYDKELIRFEEINNITKEELDVLDLISEILIEYKSKNFISSNLSKIDELLELRHLFNISNLLCIPKLNHLGRFRIKNENIKINDYFIFAWEKYCELIDTDVINCELNIDKLNESITIIKSIMFKEDKFIIESLKKILKKCGIKLYLVKNYNTVSIQGYIKYNADNTVSLFLTNRNEFADVFWFNLFHEIAHIINKDIEKSFIDYEIKKDIEDKANKVAENIIISRKSYDSFIKKNDFSIEEIYKLAKLNNVQIFMCLGRLNNDNYIEWKDYLKYRTTFNFDT